MALWRRDRRLAAEEELPWTWPESTDAVEQPSPATASTVNFSNGSGYYDGSQFFDGIGETLEELRGLDYWKLRRRSAALFYGNSYGRGIVRRFVTDIINTGLCPESIPEESILGLPEDALSGVSANGAPSWTETLEKRWRIYGESKEIIDAKGSREDGQLQAQIYTEALVSGDCLVICRQDRATNLPQISIVNGDRIQTPPDKALDESVVDGVHRDKNGRHLGYWVYEGTNEVFDDRYTYVSARGAKSNRLIAWMVYGIDKREDGVRGEPLLSIAIQPLNSILKQRGAAQLKAEISSYIIGFIKRDKAAPGTMPFGKAATRKDTVVDPAGTAGPLQLNKIMPGLFMERLAVGEEPTVFRDGSDINFGAFEAAVMVGLAWSLGCPPEILMMSFNKNYSASQAANNKWSTFKAKERPRFAAAHCKNLWEEWFVSELLLGKIEAQGFLSAYSDPKQYDIKRAWLQTEWFGQVEPSVDPVKQAAAYKTQVTEGWTTNTRTAREINGSKWSHNIKQVAKENEQKVAAMRPLLELHKEYGTDAVEAMSRIAPAMLAAAMSTEREIES
jgi:capsid protein